MIRFDDLLAARVVHEQRPELRGALASGLRELDEHKSEKGFRSLLGDLLKRGHLSREQAEYAYGLVERYKRGRAVGLYAHLLIEQGGLPRERVEATVRSLGDGADSAGLGRALVDQGQLDEETEGRLRYMAKRAWDLDQQRHLESYRGRSAAESAATMVGAQTPAYAPDAAQGPQSDTGIAEALEREKIPSGVFRMELVLPTAAEATSILDRAALDLTRAAAPHFPIPDWIDTTDAMVDVVLGRYRILGKVGAGAMATVYLADHPDHPDRPVALKVLPPAASEERKQRFKREILANGFFSHENAIDVYDAGVSDGGFHYLAMEFFDGTDLEGVLKTEGSVSLRQSLSIVRQVLQALEVAHAAGIVHRDIKPSNILVSPGATTAKLMDFGIALIKDLGEFKDKVFESDAGGVTGTPQYLSPEQAFRDPVGPPADLYSVGMVLYEMISGRLPFESYTLSGWISCHMLEAPLPIREAAPQADLPASLQGLFDRLFLKDPKERVQTAREVIEQLDSIFLGLGSGRQSRLFGKVRRGF